MPERFVAAARRIIIRDGFEALTLQGLEEEVGASRSLINYHFGGRTGLLISVVKSLFDEMDSSHDQAVAISLRGGAPKLDLDELFMTVYRERMILLVELLPHIVRTEELRLELRRMHHSQWCARTAVFRALADKYGEEKAVDISRLMSAILDGLGLQLIIDREDDEQVKYHQLWLDVVTAYLSSLDEDQQYRRAG
jgi:AcrR family transcriptional regulator